MTTPKMHGGLSIPWGLGHGLMPPGIKPNNNLVYTPHYRHGAPSLSLTLPNATLGRLATTGPRHGNAQRPTAGQQARP